LLNGPIVAGKKVNMFDNLTVDLDGNIILQEDVGNAAHNGKMFKYNPVTGQLDLIAQHDQSRFGNIGVAATSPFSQDEETSGVIDITSIMNNPLDPSALNVDPTLRWYLSSDQAHYTTGITGAQVEGGQLFALAVVPEPGTLLFGAGLGLMAGFRRMRNRRA
ncbi:MAG: PEP-CTERM sorting domain-containing protein, partial [Chthoniobacteraceae bacterium]